MGFEATSSSLTKKKVSSRSSAEEELIDVDDKTIKVMCTKRFTGSQGFKVNLNAVFQDNTSTITLAENGKTSSGKRMRHFDILLFHATDFVSRKKL